jgi:LPXTG-motif cell wall-anchored protein
MALLPAFVLVGALMIIPAVQAQTSVPSSGQQQPANRVNQGGTGNMQNQRTQPQPQTQPSQMNQQNRSPRLPSTVAGGDAAQNVAILLGSAALISLGSYVLIRKNKTA